MVETELVNGAKIKDEDAFEQLIDTYILKAHMMATFTIHLER